MDSSDEDDSPGEYHEVFEDLAEESEPEEDY